MTDEQKKQLQKDMKKYGEDMNHRAVVLFKQMADEINEVTGQTMVDPSTRQKVGKSDIDEVIMEQIRELPDELGQGLRGVAEAGREHLAPLLTRASRRSSRRTERKMEHMKRGDELPSGVLEMVKVYLATKRQLSRGRQDGRPARQQGRHRPHRARRGHAVPGGRHARSTSC